MKKYEIKTLILNDLSNNEILDKINKVFDDNRIIGYYIGKGRPYFGQIPEKLQLLCLDKVNSTNQNELIETLMNDIIYYRNDNEVKFKNPPIDNWLATHLSWVNKEVYKFARRFNLDFDEVKSDFNCSLLETYNKNFWLSNLSIVRKRFHNDMIMKYRVNKEKKYTILPLDLPIGDDDNNTLMDLIPADEPELGSKLEYELLLRTAKKLLKRKFNDREIVMILDGKTGNMFDKSLHRKMLNWRQQHTVKELYELMEEIK